MTIYGLEEHMATTEVVEAWKRADPGLTEPMMRWAVEGDVTQALLDLDDGRLAAMDDAGIDVAVLSVTTPGLQSLSAADAVALQGSTNDAIAAAVGRHPERLQGFATLATPSPRLAAAELQRAVVELGLNGAMVNARSGDCNVDAIEFWDIYEAAADLRAPIYLHPRAPRQSSTRPTTGVSGTARRTAGHRGDRLALRRRAHPPPHDHRRPVRPFPRSSGNPGSSPA